MIDQGPLLLSYFGQDGSGGARLKIGLILSGRSGQSWIRSLIEFLASVPALEVHPFVISCDAPQRPAAPGWLADRLYSLSRKALDPFGEVDLELEAAAPVLDATAHTGAWSILSRSAEETIRAAGLDMLVWLSREVVPTAPSFDLARFGVFTIRLGEESVEPPYWGEVIARQQVSRVGVHWHSTSIRRARAVRTAELATRQGWFFTRNAEECLVAASRMLAALAIELLREGPAWMERACQVPEEDFPTSPEKVYPSTLESARFAARQAANSVRVRMIGRGRKIGWFCALRRDPSLSYSHAGRFSGAGLIEIELPRGSQMADPFLVTDNEKTWLFYEEIPAGTEKGRFGCLEAGSARSGSSKPEIFMDETHHLSYPCVVKDRGEFFLVPETWELGKIQLFRATRFPLEWKLETVFLENLEATDTTPFFHDGRWYFFTSTTEPFMETLLFWSDSLGGRWHLHPRSPVSRSVRNSRSAGHLFYQDGRLLRPTQDCSIRYGYGITINEVTRLTSTEFEERSVDFIAPDWRRGLLGTHTINSNGRFEVLDGLRYLP